MRPFIRRMAVAAILAVTGTASLKATADTREQRIALVIGNADYHAHRPAREYL